MGTSSSYGGPKGVTSLLPPWAEPADEVPPAEPPAPPPADGTEQQPAPAPAVPGVPWGQPKNLTSRWARGTSSGGPARALRSYVSASGGGRGAARRAVAGRATAQRLGGFLAAGVGGGFAAAAAAIGLTTFIGRDADALLNELVDRLAPDGALLDDAAARQAAILTWEEVFERLDVAGAGFAALDRIDRAMMEDIVRGFVTHYVAERFLQELGDCIDRGAISAAAANDLYREVRDFIRETVRLDFGGVDLVATDWDGDAAQTRVEGVFAAAYGFIEAL